MQPYRAQVVPPGPASIYRTFAPAAFAARKAARPAVPAPTTATSQAMGLPMRPAQTGAAPSCLRMPSSSEEPHRSTILPLSKRPICIPRTSIDLPVADTP